MSKHKKHIPKSDSFLKKVFSKAQSKEAYTDLEWEAKQGLERLGEDGASEALARIHKRIESQKRIPSKKPIAIPIWRYAAAAACIGVMVFIGNKVIDSVNNQAPTSYNTTAPSTGAEPVIKEEKLMNDSASSKKEPVAPNNDSDIETERKEKVDTALTDDQESRARSYNNKRLPRSSPAEPPRVIDVPSKVIAEGQSASEPDAGIDMKDNSSSQGSEVVAQEENLPEEFMEDDMAPNAMIDDEVLPAETYRSSGKNSLSTEDMADSYTQDSAYNWSVTFEQGRYKEIIKRFKKSYSPEQETNEEAMFFAARAYHALGKPKKARKTMEEVVTLNGDKVKEAQGFLKEWKE